jgi:hypothetical protein
VTTRAEVAARRRARFVQMRRSRVQCPADEAALEYDLVRDGIRRIRDRDAQDAAWRRLAEHLRTFGGDPQ